MSLKRKEGLSIIGQEIFDISNLQFNICTTFILRMLTLDQVGQDPVHEVRDPGVDPRVAGLRAPVTKADDADQEPGAGLGVIEHQGAATVPLTRVPAPVSVARTQEHLGDWLEIRLRQEN